MLEKEKIGRDILWHCISLGRFCRLGLFNHRETFCANKCSTNLVVVYTCVSHEWPRYIVSLFESRTPLHVLLRAFVKTAENSCRNNCLTQPTNKFSQNKVYRRCSIKATEQCNFVKCLSVLIAREHRLQLPFDLQELICFVVVSWFVLLSLMIAEIFSLLKVKLNLKICTRRKTLLIFFLKAGCCNKYYE